MRIELRGIVQFYNDGHKYVQVVVKDDSHVQHVVHDVGVDIDVNRGKILTFLEDLYGIPPGGIVWPEHIVLKEGDDSMSLPL